MIRLQGYDLTVHAVLYQGGLMKLNETSQMFNNSSASVDQGTFVEQHGLFVACVFVDSINITFCTLIILIGLADCEDIISYYVTDTVCRMRTVLLRSLEMYCLT